MIFNLVQKLKTKRCEREFNGIFLERKRESEGEGEGKKKDKTRRKEKK